MFDDVLAKVVGGDLAPMKEDDMFVEFLECVGPEGARDVEFVVVGAGEVWWFQNGGRVCDLDRKCIYHGTVPRQRDCTLCHGTRAPWHRVGTGLTLCPGR